VRYELPQSEDRRIWDIWLSMHQLPAMAVADELGLFEALDALPATSEETARQLGLNPRATGVLTSMLTALGLTMHRRGRVELTDLTRTYLLRQSPYYWGPVLRALGNLPQQREALIRALTTADDAAAIPNFVPSKSWESGKMDRAYAEEITRIMHCHSLPASVGLARSGIFDHVSRLLDVGGGSGCFSIAIAQQLADIRGTVMDLAPVCEAARDYIVEGGVSDRIDTYPIDMLREVWPGGYDGILFSNIFHDWNPGTNRFLARCAFSALPSGGRIFLHEMLLADDGSGPATTASFSILMLLGTQGRQYAFRELRDILADCGFVDISARVTYGYYSVVVARKP
jgi:hypothetical protein